jgi:23S rRNA-/tRNA-specific pseudouridylate synthase
MYIPTCIYKLVNINTSAACCNTFLPSCFWPYRRRTLRKEYWAIALGVPHDATFSVCAPIDRHPTHDTARRCAPEGKPAHTDFEVVASNPDLEIAAALAAPGELFSERGSGTSSTGWPDNRAVWPRGVSLIRCWPRSGRTHQIRVHLAYMGHPLLGDELYGMTVPWIGRQALHARSLMLSHPLDQRQLHFVAPLHADFEAALSVLGLSPP